MIGAYLAEFRMYVFAEDQPDAVERVKVWRGLAAGMGFEPGPGCVTGVSDGALPGPAAEALARARKNDVATPSARWQAITTLAKHFDGDVGFATELVESIEQEHGSLPAGVANALANAREPRQAAA
jgi:hypothetical protein